MGNPAGEIVNKIKALGRTAPDRFFVGKGELCVRNGEACVEVKKGQDGYVLYGPYEEFPAGNYEVKFEILVDENFEVDGQNFCCVEVNSGSDIVDKVVVASAYPSQNGVMTVTLPFSIDAPRRLEFRLQSLGTRSILVKHDRTVGPGNSGNNVTYGQFYRNNNKQFMKYHFMGAKLQPAPDGVNLEWMGVKCLLKNKGDLNVFDEIFCLRQGKPWKGGRKCDLKPFAAVQRVRRPPGRGAARQPEASLAWVAATSLVKRRQRMLKPCVSLDIFLSAEAFGLWNPGAASTRPP